MRVETWRSRNHALRLHRERRGRPGRLRLFVECIRTDGSVATILDVTLDAPPHSGGGQPLWPRLSRTAALTRPADPADIHEWDDEGVARFEAELLNSPLTLAAG